jgi:hypothetical protein
MERRPGAEPPVEEENRAAGGHLRRAIHFRGGVDGPEYPVPPLGDLVIVSHNVRVVICITLAREIEGIMRAIRETLNTELDESWNYGSQMSMDGFLSAMSWVDRDQNC